jgi:GntR family transcriptional regulator/MocR family aminotransferase
MAALSGGNVAHLGSTSKTLVPRLRIGWMVLRGRHHAAVARVLDGDRTGPPTLDQRALAQLIDRVGYDRHLRTMRREYQQRRAGLIAALTDAVPQACVQGVDAGVHLLVHLRDADEDALVRELDRQGLRVTALSDCRIQSAQAPGVLIGYGNLSPHRMTDVAHAVAEALAQQQNSAAQAPAAPGSRRAPRLRPGRAGAEGKSTHGR